METQTTALAPAANAAIVMGGDDAANAIAKQQALAARLPAMYRDDVLFLKRPSPAELAQIVQELPSDMQSKVMDLVRKTRPKKQGVHTSREGFTPTDIRLFQGTGNDPVRPRNCLPGQFYTTESKNLETPFDAAVILFYEGRTLWPPRDNSGSNSNGEGGSAKVPLCSSLDRKKGTRYGECLSCPKATAKYNEGGCGREVVAFLVDRDLTGIYVLRFTKSSLGAGEAMTKILARSDEIYGRWFRFETQERTQGTNRYFVMKASPVVDQKNEANQYVPKELHPLFNAFSRLCEADVYYPGLADAYTRAESSTDGDSAAGETLNEAELTGKAGASTDNPDYSM